MRAISVLLSLLLIVAMMTGCAAKTVRVTRERETRVSDSEVKVIPKFSAWGLEGEEKVVLLRFPKLPDQEFGKNSVFQLYVMYAYLDDEEEWCLVELEDYTIFTAQIPDNDNYLGGRVSLPSDVGTKFAIRVECRETKTNRILPVLMDDIFRRENEKSEPGCEFTYDAETGKVSPIPEYDE